MAVRSKSNSGFTLIELMIVIAIVGILAAIAIPNFIAYREKAMIASATSELKVIELAIQSLAVDTGCWPTENASKISAGHITGSDEMEDLSVPEAGLAATDGNYPGWAGPYLNGIPKDPWGNNYFWDPDYKINGEDCVVIGSYGPNGEGLNDYDDDDILVIMARP